MSQAPGGYSDNRRSDAEAVYDGVPHWHEYDGQDGARPGWPHHSVGVPGPAQRVMSQAPGAYSDNRRNEAAAIYRDGGVPHRRGYDGQDGARPGWPHQLMAIGNRIEPEIGVSLVEALPDKKSLRCERSTVIMQLITQQSVRHEAG
jgi:hypothetical protein